MNFNWKILYGSFGEKDVYFLYYIILRIITLDSIDNTRGLIDGAKVGAVDLEKPLADFCRFLAGLRGHQQALRPISHYHKHNRLFSQVFCVQIQPLVFSRGSSGTQKWAEKMSHEVVACATNLRQEHLMTS